MLLALVSQAAAAEPKAAPTPILGPPTPFSDMMLDVQRLLDVSPQRTAR